jgi:hypothetical protein
MIWSSSALVSAGSVSFAMIWLSSLASSVSEARSWQAERPSAAPIAAIWRSGTARLMLMGILSQPAMPQKSRQGVRNHG